jgi:hypothetical protein
MISYGPRRVPMLMSRGVDYTAGRELEMADASYSLSFSQAA